MIFLNKSPKKDNRATINWVAKRTKKFLPSILLMSFLEIGISVIMIALAYISRLVIDNGDNGGGNKLFISAVALFSVIFLQLSFDAISSMLSVRVTGKYINSMRSFMFNSIIHKKYSKLFGRHSGDVLNRFTSDIDTVASGSLNIIPYIFSIVTKIILGSWALISENWILAIIIILIGFIFPLFGRLVSKKYKSTHKEVQQSEGDTRAFIQESFSNIVVIKTFSSGSPILNKLSEYMQKNLNFKLKRNIYSVIIHTLLTSFFTFGYYAVLVFGASKLATGIMTYGTLNYYLQLITILKAPLQNVSGILPTYYSMLASAERLIELESIEEEPEIIDEDKFEELSKEFEKIEIKNLAFGYDDQIVIKNCSFDIRKNEITAITGESGSGKSTLFKLVLGLYEPTGGSITFNGKTPVDASTRGMFSYVPQDNMIISGTIRDNITLSNPEITDEQIEAATKSAVIYDFIMSLPDKFDTVLSERGGGLSQGQLQRLSIARALIFDAPILLLDESTSALDEETETQLLSNIKHISGKTILFITHRHTSLSVCDSIVRIEDKKYSVVK